jgi:gamma-glutamyltranspeptidase/glutathione hydrolase
VPVAELISQQYADARRQLIKPDRALKDVAAGDLNLGKDTIYLCVVDKDHNCVSLIESNYGAFGSYHVPGKLGFILQNRGSQLSLDEKHANRLEPGRRPFHTIIPAMATKNGKPWFVFGVMGGDMQPQGQVQVLVNLIDLGMDVQQAGEAPRIEHVGHPTPTGRPGDPDGGTVQAERGIPESVVAGLQKLGHKVKRVPYNGGGYQGILIDPVTGVLHGGTEARKDGCAAGY